MPTTAPQNCYETLGLTPKASLEEIKERYRQLALKLHPDVNEGNPITAREFVRVIAAYKTLTDPAAREQHDTQLQETQRQEEAQRSWEETQRFQAQWQQQQIAFDAEVAFAHKEPKVRKKRPQVKEWHVILLLLLLSFGSLLGYRIVQDIARQRHMEFTRRYMKYWPVPSLPASISDDMLISQSLKLEKGDSLEKVQRVMTVAPVSVRHDNSAQPQLIKEIIKSHPHVVVVESNELAGQHSIEWRNGRRYERIYVPIPSVTYQFRGENKLGLILYFQRGRLVRKTLRDRAQRPPPWPRPDEDYWRP